jgi:uncharacterized protein YggE
MKRYVCLLAFITLLGTATGRQVLAQSHDKNPPRVKGPSTLTVSGHGEVRVAPDRALLRLGAVAQAPSASLAQNQANQIVQNIIKGITSLGVAGRDIATGTLSLSPLYDDQPPEPRQRTAQPSIRGYRATNIIGIQIEDLTTIGPLIDVGLDAGANRVAGISFDLRDDGDARRQALRQAAAEADEKAGAIARAMGVEIMGIQDITERGVNLIRPQADAGAVFSAGRTQTPVQAGQVRVEASLEVSYLIAEPVHRDRKTTP